MRPSWRFPLATLGALLIAGPGCDSVGGTSRPTTGHANDGIDRDTQVAVLLADTIQTLQRLSGGNPAEQAEIVSAARQG